MKKLLLTAAALTAFTYSTFAQAYLTESGTADTVKGIYAGSEDVKVHNHIYSPTATPVKVKWKVIAHSLPTGWGMQGFCDNGACYPPTSILDGLEFTSFNYDATPADNLFYAWFKASDATPPSTAFVTLNVIDVDGSTDRNLTFIASKFPTGLTQVSVSEDNVILYPNPARSNINVVYGGKEQISTVSIYNMIGKLVNTWKISNNNGNLSIDALPPGAYMMRLQDAGGKVIATRRFNHQ